uniref:Uncharacterized protein n=1 Tax=Nothobranchius furzeri TaxID=105023 RepID=A0A8C6L565_NOTFU
GAKLGGHAHSDLVTHPEVIRIHMELLRVHHTQLGVGVLDVVQVLHSRLQSTHHGLSMVGHFGVSDNGRIGGQVSKVGEVGLSLRVDDQHPGQEHIHFAPEGLDSVLVLGCETHPVGRSPAEQRDNGSVLKASSCYSVVLPSSCLIRCAIVSFRAKTQIY